MQAGQGGCCLKALPTTTTGPQLHKTPWLLITAFCCWCCCSAAAVSCSLTAAAAYSRQSARKRCVLGTVACRLHSTMQLTTWARMLFPSYLLHASAGCLHECGGLICTAVAARCLKHSELQHQQDQACLANCITDVNGHTCNAVPSR